MLSVVIPSWKDPNLHKTIQSILDNFTGEFEIIVVLDGYWPEQPVKNDPRVVVLHTGKNHGMREAINAGVKVARGEYIMRTDEHCMFAPGFDEAITSVIKDDEIMTATRYFLDPDKWERMDLPPVNHEKLIVQGKGKDFIKFAGYPWKSRDKHRKDRVVDETMAMQGSCWVMKKSWWEKCIKALQTEGYGPLYQDSHEMVFKTWKMGGKLMVNKNTWFAHKHWTFSRTHQYGVPQAKPGWEYSYNKWKDYYEKEVLPKWFPS